jgi:hypothetical protein
MISSNGNWHSDYIKLCKTRSIESLEREDGSSKNQ